MIPNVQVEISKSRDNSPDNDIEIGQRSRLHFKDQILWFTVKAMELDGRRRVGVSIPFTIQISALQLRGQRAWVKLGDTYLPITTPRWPSIRGNKKYVGSGAAHTEDAPITPTKAPVEPNSTVTGTDEQHLSQFLQSLLSLNIVYANAEYTPRIS